MGMLENWGTAAILLHPLIMAHGKRELGQTTENPAVRGFV